MATLTLDWTDHPPAEVTGGAVTVGNFDGVHRGHQALVAAAGRWARRVGGPAVAVTFDPPPPHVLVPGSGRLPLTTVRDRAALLHAAGADHVVVIRTTPELLALSPEAFFEDILVRQVGAKAVVEGYNFRFGRARTGDVATLRELCGTAGVGFEELPQLVVGDAAVSSSRVRAALVAGDVAAAADLLGRTYWIRGRVVEGAKRGRTIGFPTANVGNVETLLPAEGVYAVRVEIDGPTYPAGGAFLGAANVGPNPTFGDDARKIEVHLLDFGGDIYGHDIAVGFAARLRETRPFAGPAALVEQLRKDVAAARVALEAAGG